MIRILHIFPDEMPVEKLVSIKGKTMAFRFIHNVRSDSIILEIRRNDKFLYSTKLVYGVQGTHAVTEEELPWIGLYRPEDFNGKFPADVRVSSETFGSEVLFYFEDGRS